MNGKKTKLLATALMMFVASFIVKAENVEEKFSEEDDRAQAKAGVDISSPISTMSTENISYYRRLRSIRDDNATTEGSEHLDPDAENALDAPKTLRIVRYQNSSHFLYEDALSQSVFGKGINFLGLANESFNLEKLFPDGSVKYNYHLFFDTAFINRGTGHIKPQYMIAVGINAVKRQKISGKNHTGASVTKTIKSYVEGRYLINATDSARGFGYHGYGSGPSIIRNIDYIMSPDRDLLAFVNAIHVYDDDRLYIVSELVKNGVTRDQYIITTGSGEEFIDGDALDAMTKTVDGVPGKLVGTERKPDNSLMYGAYYQFSTWDNAHNDVCFSLRFVSPNVKNADESGADTNSNLEKCFYIESEAANRNPLTDSKIASDRGGWISIRNGIPAIIRNNNPYDPQLNLGDAFTIAEPAVTDWQGGKATATPHIDDSQTTAFMSNGNLIVKCPPATTISVYSTTGTSVKQVVSQIAETTISIPKGIYIVTVGTKSIKIINN
jgi:hypothetical protein